MSRSIIRGIICSCADSKARPPHSLATPRNPRPQFTTQVQCSHGIPLTLSPWPWLLDRLLLLPLLSTLPTEPRKPSTSTSSTSSLTKTSARRRAFFWLGGPNYKFCEFFQKFLVFCLASRPFKVWSSRYKVYTRVLLLGSVLFVVSSSKKH